MTVQYFNLKSASQLYTNFIKKLYVDLPLSFHPHHHFNESYFKHGLQIIQNEKTVALVVIYYNPFVNFNNEKVLQIGNYECVADDIVANFLWVEINKVIKLFGFSCAIGPMDGSTWDNYRFTSEGLDQPLFITERWQQPHYLQQWKDNQCMSLANYVSTKQNNLSFYKKEKMDQLEVEAIQNGYTFGTIDIESYEQELNQLAIFCNQAFKQNFLFSPIDTTSFVNKYLPFKKFIIPELVWVARYNGTIVALNFSIPDLLNQNEKGIVMKTVATFTNKETRGFTYILSNKIINFAIKNDYKYIIHAFMLSDNISKTAAGRYNSNAFKQYQLLKYNCI